LIKAEDNPDPFARGFLNNAQDYGNYDASKNIIPNLPNAYPLSNNAITSIFSVIQRDNSNDHRCGTNANRTECVEFVDFLTIYRAAPGSGGRNSIRPTIFGDHKQVYTWSDFDRTRIPSFDEAEWDFTDAQVLDLISKWTATTEGFSIPVCSQGFAECNFVSEGGRAFRSHAVIDDYATDGGQNRVLSYFLNTSSDVINDTEDAALLAAVIAYGIDIITLIGNPPSDQLYGFASGAGQFMNAANFSYFAAALTQRNSFAWRTMHEAVRELIDSRLVDGPQEAQQVFDAGGAIPPSFCDINTQNFREEESNSVCQNSTVIVDNVFQNRLSYDMDGTSIVFNEAIPAGTKIRVSPITNQDQGWLEGNRAAGDPYGHVDGPPGVPGSGYFEVSNRRRIEWAGIAQAIPELCEIIDYPPMFDFVERYVSSGLKMSNDPCAPPSSADATGGTCDAFGSRNCVDFGRSNNGTVRWGPDPRDSTQCVLNNRLLTLQTDGSWIESFENRGDNGRYSNLDGVRNALLPSTFSAQYLAFKGNRSCGSTTVPTSSSGELCLPIKIDGERMVLICI